MKLIKGWKRMSHQGGFVNEVTENSVHCQERIQRPVKRFCPAELFEVLRSAS